MNLYMGTFSKWKKELKKNTWCIFLHIILSCCASYSKNFASPLMQNSFADICSANSPTQWVDIRPIKATFRWQDTQIGRSKDRYMDMWIGIRAIEGCTWTTVSQFVEEAGKTLPTVQVRWQLSSNRGAKGCGIGTTAHCGFCICTFLFHNFSHVHWEKRGYPFGPMSLSYVFVFIFWFFQCQILGLLHLNIIFYNQFVFNLIY